ncbi:MAG TPA: hypothetical protein P5511_04805 [Candidatus Goldiibacteriota bacterium]|nr:hypothetical protein [Candidatus Goldiibacteriota bacterium]
MKINYTALFIATAICCLACSKVVPALPAEPTLTVTMTVTVTLTATQTRTPVNTSTPVVYRFEQGASGWTLKTPDVYPQSAGFIDMFTNTEPAFIYAGAGSLGINCSLKAAPMARRGDFSVDLSAEPAGFFGKTIRARIYVTAGLASLASNPYAVSGFVVSAGTGSVYFSAPFAMTNTGWNVFSLPVSFDAAVSMAGIRVRSEDGANALTYEGMIYIDEISW